MSNSTFKSNYRSIDELTDDEFLALCEEVGRKLKKNPPKRPLTNDELRALGAINETESKPEAEIGRGIVIVGLSTNRH